MQSQDKIGKENGNKMTTAAVNAAKICISSRGSQLYLYIYGFISKLFWQPVYNIQIENGYKLFETE